MNDIASTKLPDFVIVGAMKSATTTIYEQLKKIDGIYMPDLKEPNFFSNDEEYARGMGWYQSLFQYAKDTDLIGEASTHYTKLPTYENSVDRIYQHLPKVKIIYIMRDPIDRLVSQYIHEWTCNNINCSIDEAVTKFPELVEYSEYYRQIKPYLDKFGKNKVLPVFFEKIKQDPHRELNRITQFIGYPDTVVWAESSSQANTSSERLRLSPVMNVLVNAPALSRLRKKMIPSRIRNAIKNRMRMRKRPEIGDEVLIYIRNRINIDLSMLGALLGFTLNVDNYKQVILSNECKWQVEEVCQNEETVANDEE